MIVDSGVEVSGSAILEIYGKLGGGEIEETAQLDGRTL